MRNMDKTHKNAQYVTSCSECLLFLRRTPYIMTNIQPQVKFFHTTQQELAKRNSGKNNVTDICV